MNLPNTWAKKIQQVSIRGIPDILGCINGHFIAIELKMDKTGQLDELQKYELSQIKKAKGHIFIATPQTWSNALKELTRLAVQPRVNI